MVMGKDDGFNPEWLLERERKSAERVERNRRIYAEEQMRYKRVRGLV